MTRSVAQKMGVKEGARSFFANAPTPALEAIELPELEISENLTGDFDYIHLFSSTRAEMNHTFPLLKGPEAAEGEAIWSLSCMYIHRRYRGAGIGHQLIDAAVKFARKRKADIVEAYAVDPDSPSYRNMGFIPAYEKAGFKRVEKLGTRRTIMRLAL
mgnify:CR=1 FL=1